jgi:hypothetical protein
MFANCAVMLHVTNQNLTVARTMCSNDEYDDAVATWMCFPSRIMLLVRLSLIHGENPTSCTQYTCSLQFTFTPFRLLTVELMMHDPSLMHTRIGLLSSETCMTITTAKLPGLITTSLILPHPSLTAVACCLQIIMNGHPQCSLYATVLILLHVTITLHSLTLLRKM